jgi:hypothetical protein
MMPTSPSLPLKFRTAGFPQYGFKASRSGRACRSKTSIVCVGPSSASVAEERLALCPSQSAHSASRCARGHSPLYPRGPWLRLAFCCREPSSRTTTPSVSLAGTQGLHGRAAYTLRLRCAHSPRRPARPSLLSPLRFPHVPSTLRRRARTTCPVAIGRRCQASSSLDRVATQRVAVSASYARRTPISALHRSLYATARAFAKPSGLAATRWSHVCSTGPSEDLVAPAFGAVRRRTALGARLDG